MSDELKPLRDKIDTIDNAILQLLVDRVAVVKKIGEIKTRAGVKPLDTKRRDALLQEKVKKANKLGLDETFIKKLFLAIHDYGVAIQKRK